MNLRIGFGYDIHRLVEGRPLHLGCVELPYSKGLLGHSDGDAAAHALADALLSAAGLGEIGERFPPGDPAWAGASGRRILEATRQLLMPGGWSLIQADLTIVAEVPKLQPHRQEMIRALSQALGCEPARVSLKARTQEGLGAIGRGEAIAAYALVLLTAGNP